MLDSVGFFFAPFLAGTNSPELFGGKGGIDGPKKRVNTAGTERAGRVL